MKKLFRKVLIFIAVLLLLPFVARCALDGVKWVGNYYVSVIFPGAKKFQNFRDKLPDFQSWRDKWSGEDKEPAPDDNKSDKGWKWRLGAPASLDRWIASNLPAGVSEESIGRASVAFWDAGEEIKRDPVDSVEEALAVAKKYLFADTGEEWRPFLAELTDQIKEIPVESSEQVAELYQEISRALYNSAQKVRANSPAPAALEVSSPPPPPAGAADSDKVADKIAKGVTGSNCNGGNCYTYPRFPGPFPGFYWLR